MFAIILAQSTGDTLSPAILFALFLIAMTSALALIVSVRIARRIRAIGERQRPPNDRE